MSFPPQSLTLVIPARASAAFVEAVKEAIEGVYQAAHVEGSFNVIGLLDEEYDEMDAATCVDILTANRGVQ